MKKLYFYAMVIACLFCTASIHAQDRFWILASGTPGDWSNSANWSTSAIGGGGASVPNGAGFNAIFPNGATVNVDVAAITLNRLSVLAGTARLVANTASVITVSSGTVGSEGVRVETGATLESGIASAVPFSITFANGARGLINGTWLFTGQPGVNPPNGATFTLPAAGNGNRLDINGTLRFNSNTRIPIPGVAAGSEYIFFNSSSTYWLDRDAGAVIPANWNANSTVRLTGIVNFGPVFNLSSTTGPNFGHLVVDCPAMNNTTGEPIIVLGLANNMNFQGNVDILNTNNFPFGLVTGVSNPTNFSIGGNLNVSGNSRVYIGDRPDASFAVQVGGNFNLSGGNFLMQFSDGVANNTTVLAVRGNVNHTGGTFGVTSNSTSTTTDLFVLEMNGTGAQTITSTGIIDNANNALTLRLNNNSGPGVTLGSPVAVGKISWASANKGILNTTSTNLLTIRNGEATNATVVNAPANNGYVNGPVRRLTNSTGVYLLPTGKSGVLRYCEVIPSATTASTYTGEYFGSAYPNLTPLNPLTGVSNQEYWDISRQSGSSAAVQLNLAGQVPGTNASHGVVVARFNGSNWVSVKGDAGTVITPGNASAGSARSDDMPTFSPFTLAFGPIGALPIDLVSFTARKVGNSAALLEWTVTASSTPERFEVLRSTDGTNFATIGSVNGVDQQLNYSYTDNNLPNGATYYRLRMIDKDGDVKLSKTVVITNGTDGIFLTGMTPTIVTGRARIGVTASQRGSLQLVITDMYGRIVKQQINTVDQGSQDIWLNLYSLASGAYQVTGYIDGKRTASIRFIKQ
jgi:hypothetical protein